MSIIGLTLKKKKSVKEISLGLQPDRYLLEDFIPCVATFTKNWQLLSKQTKYFLTLLKNSYDLQKCNINYGDCFYKAHK